jgi:hypothetical protein
MDGSTANNKEGPINKKNEMNKNLHLPIFFLRYSGHIMATASGRWLLASGCRPAASSQ